MKGREGYDDPKHTMALRRLALLLFGILGGMLAAAALYISAESIVVADAMLPTGIDFSQEVIKEEPQQIKELILPVGVPGTALIAQRLSAYDGPFLEDGSDREVIGIAALLVYNGGSREILSAQITLQFGDNTYHFSGENIPAGGLVVLLEKEAKAYRQDAPNGCTGWQVVSQKDTEMQKQIAVTDREKGMLSVTNLTDQTLENVCLFYKSWLSPPDIYVGGISYCVMIPQLFPGQSLCVYPAHYATGYSRVVSVTVDSEFSG